MPRGPVPSLETFGYGCAQYPLFTFCGKYPICDVGNESTFVKQKVGNAAWPHFRLLPTKKNRPLRGEQPGMLSPALLKCDKGNA